MSVSMIKRTSFSSAPWVLKASHTYHKKTAAEAHGTRVSAGMVALAPGGARAGIVLADHWQ